MIEALILAIKIARALVEVAGFCLLGQGIVAVFAGASRDRNPIYLLFRTVTRPVVSAMRAITPRFVIDRHLPYLTFFVLFWLWILLAVARLAVCRANGLSC